MTDFEAMTDDKFNGYLCETVKLLDQIVRNQGYETVPDYRKKLVEADRICMEPVEDKSRAYGYIRIPYAETK